MVAVLEVVLSLGLAITVHSSPQSQWREQDGMLKLFEPTECVSSIDPYNGVLTF